MRICFDMHEAVYRNNETVMEYSSSMKKNRFDPGRSRQFFIALMKMEINI